MINKLTFLLSASTLFPLRGNPNTHEAQNRNHLGFINTLKETKLTQNNLRHSYNSLRTNSKLFVVHSKSLPPSKQTIHSGILSESVCDSLPQQINWIIRDDFRKIYKSAHNLFDENPAKANSEFNPKTFTNGYQWHINPEQSDLLLSELINFYHQQFNFTKSTIFQFDHALLLIKPNTTKRELFQAIIDVSGELGLQTFKNTTIEKSLHFPKDTGLIFAIRPWQQQYITALLKQLNVQSIVRENLNNRSLAGKACFKASFQKIQQRLSKLQQAGTIQKRSWFTPSLSRLIYNQVCSTICFERYHQKIPGPLPCSVKAINQEGLLKLLKNPDMTSLSHEVAEAIEAGYINIHLLKDSAFRKLCHDLPGIDRTHINGGFAVGAQAFIHDKQYRAPPDEQSETSHEINLQLAGIMLHEAVHALDWLKNPKAYIINLTNNINGILEIETRAYKEQRHLLHLHQAPFCFDSPDPKRMSDDDFLKAVIINRYWRPPT